MTSGMARSFFDLANEPKQAFWVKGADHNDLDQVAGVEYAKALQRFVALLDNGPNTGT